MCATVINLRCEDKELLLVQFVSKQPYQIIISPVVTTVKLTKLSVMSPSQ